MDRFGPIMAIVAGLAFLFIGVVILSGCASTHPRERPFSPEWVQLQQTDAELKRREEHIDRVDRIVLFGSPEEGGARISKDKQGDTKLRVGKDNGVGVDVGYSGGPKVKVKYEMSWDQKRPTQGRPRQ